VSQVVREPHRLRPTREAVAHLRALLRDSPQPAWATHALVGLGFAASLAETLGITLIVAFVYAALGQGAVGGDWLGTAMARLQTLLGSPARMALAILALILARAGLSFLNRAMAARVSEQISENTRNRVHEQYLSVTYGRMQRYEEAQLIEVLGSESWLIARAHDSLTRIVIGGCSIAVFAGFLVALSWPIALTACAGSLLLALLLRRLARPAQALGRDVKRVHQTLGEHMLLTIQGLRTIRAYAQERVHHERFVRSSAQAHDASLTLARLSARLDPITEVAYLAMLCVIVVLALRWGVGLATLLAATALLYRLQPHVRSIEGHLLFLAHIEPQLRSVRAMLQRDDKPYDADGPRPVDTLRQGITFDAVTFAYDDGLAPALDGVSFEIPAGRTTALAGASGSGKTTVINLLLRLYAPQSGTIRVDGVPLNELRRTDWLALLAVAGQDVDLIEGTVVDNIRMADASASDEAVREAARIAGVEEFVQPLPNGYDTWIGQQGHRFSGGQRQRLGLARALLRKPQLLILDEATNALDPEMEQRIRAAIDAHLPACTRLVISHRDGAWRNADCVIRLQAGRIVGRPDQAERFDGRDGAARAS
jgi:ABC-type multidrug transport system fused ATPase/permease subunit